MVYRLALFIVACVTTSLLDLNQGVRASVLSKDPSTFNVLNYGAVGDGKHDDTQAFSKAWINVCNASRGNPTLVVPQGKTFLLKSIIYNGPCKSTTIHVEIQGNIVAPDSIGEWNKCEANTWLIFRNVDNLFVEGSGEIDARGSIWWKNVHETNVARSCNRPATIRFQSCNGLLLKGLTYKNSGGNHISIQGSNNSTISNIKIIAPGDSPNTDGIDLSSIEYLNILDSIIGTGDDCIAIGSGSRFINVKNVTCGPGHGISVGSLGKDGDQAKVEEVHVTNCTFSNTTNGARIKTWQGGSGYARKISYQNIILKDVQNPIIIDQFYCFGDCSVKPLAVSVSEVKFSGFLGTSASEEAITLNCSRNIPCNNIVLETIAIKSTTLDPKKNVTSVCAHARVQQKSVQPPVHCI